MPKYSLNIPTEWYEELYVTPTPQPKLLAMYLVLDQSVLPLVWSTATTSSY